MASEGFSVMRGNIIVSKLLRLAVIGAAVLPMTACAIFSELRVLDYYTPASAEDRQAILERERLFRARIQAEKYGWTEYYTWKSYYVDLLLDDERFLRFLTDDDFARTVIEQIAGSDSASVHKEFSIHPLDADQLERFSRTISPGTGS